MEDSVNKISKQNELVVDLFSGILATEKACLGLPWYRHVAGCKVDADCFEASMKTQVATYVI